MSAEVVVPEPRDGEDALPAFVVPGAHSKLGEATQLWLESQRSPRTVKAYAVELRMYAAFLAEQQLDPLMVRKMQVDRYLSVREAGVSRAKAAATVARTRAALSSWYEYLVGCDLLLRNPMKAARKIRVDRDHSGTRVLSQDEARRLEYAAEHQPPRRGGRDTRERDLLIVRLLLRIGMRAEELCDLRFEEFRIQRGKPVVVLRSKGGKRITRSLAPEVQAGLHRYLTHRLRLPLEQAGAKTLTNLLARFPEDGLLVVTDTGRAVGRPQMTRMLQRIAKQAGIERPTEITPHALRHTFATVATEAGAKLDDLQDAMGHADPRTTRRYQRSARKLEHDPTHLVSAALG